MGRHGRVGVGRELPLTASAFDLEFLFTDLHIIRYPNHFFELATCLK